MNTWIAIIVVLGVIFFGAYGGTMNKNGGLFKIASSSQPGTNLVEVKYPEELKTVDAQKTEPGAQTQTETNKIDSSKSKYSDIISIYYISRSADPSSEYVQIVESGSATTSVDITGWTLKSESTSQNATIPKAIYLFFAGSPNYEEDIVLKPSESVYLNTGYSPNGASFKTNKCSGYLSQFQNFNPSLPYFCPSPRNEDPPTLTALFKMEIIF